MKVAIIHHSYKKGGGMESYLLDLISGFLHRGDSVTVFTQRVNSELAASLPSVAVSQYRTWWCPKKYREFSFIHKINKKFNRSDFDLSLSLSRSSNQDVTITGGTHLGFLATIPKRMRLKDRFIIYCEQKSFEKAPCIIAHSSMLANEIIHLYHTDPKKVHLLHPPINVDQFYVKSK